MLSPAEDEQAVRQARFVTSQAATVFTLCLAEYGIMAHRTRTMRRTQSPKAGTTR